MQTIEEPLTIEDFEKGAITVISKVEIDTGGGIFKELPDVKTYNISTNEENRVAKFCSYSFNITCLNTDDRYDPLNSGSSHYNWLKQGRRIKLWAGLKKNETPYPYQLILGRIDNFKLGKRAGQDICTISGRCLMRMVLDFKLYSPNTHWGTNHNYNTVANKIRYDMEADCKGIYKVELDYTNKDGTALEEIFERSDWTYDWHNNKLVFTSQRIPDFAGTNNLKVYYFQFQSVENVVADILLAAGIFANETKKNDWLASEYCTATEKTIDRVWFTAGTSALKAITLLSEVVWRRFYFDYAGNPIFKPKPSAGSPVNTISDYEAKIENVEENVDETYTHIIVIGEERDRVLGDDETKPATPSPPVITTGLGSPTQASLAWIKAEWSPNTESDFGHYELRIRKTAYPDYYTEVSTIATSFIWYGLESGIEYGVQIRAVDIYNNRSEEWSAEVTIVTATDETTPVQITRAVATAILAGIKVEWNAATEDNIAGYIVERQESDDGVTWPEDEEWWIERVRILTTMWMDLLLPYAKFYRYRIKTFTQTGVEGTASIPTADSIAANKAGANDIVAKCITSDQIYGNKLSVIFADMGSITAGDITLNSSGFIRTSGKTSYDSTVAGFWLGYDVDKYKLNIGNASRYIKWDGSVLDIAGNIKVGGFETNQEIYFKDSQMYLYDKFDGNNQIIAIRRTASPIDYFRFYRIIGGQEARLEIRNVDGMITMIEVAPYGLDSAMAELSCVHEGHHTKLYMISAGTINRNYFMYDTGQIQLPNLGADPTENLSAGQLAIVNNVLRIYNGASWSNV